MSPHAAGDLAGAPDLASVREASLPQRAAVEHALGNADQKGR